MASIQAIDRDSIKRICSGQVVVDLATAVKEMVENSLDAGATSVEVKVKECGADWIEVSDNGSGIDPSNYASIALKHHTSKLAEFADLNNVTSFGFRGEALNALCELSGSFTVTTKQATEQIGTKLIFAKDGSVSSEQPVARATGTTVVVNNLFEALPVRRGEFIRSIKKHYQKMVKILQSYAIIAVGIRLVVTNIGKGSKQIVIGTMTGNSMSDNISTVFGSSFLSSLMPLSIVVPIVENHENTGISKPMDIQIDSTSHEEEEIVISDSTIDTANEIESKAIDMSQKKSATDSCTSSCSIHGYVSKVGVGVGRSDNDRQFVFCNGRPVDIPKFTKVLNEVSACFFYVYLVCFQ